MTAPVPTPPRLFSPGQVAVATFLGGVPAGAILIAWNYRALSRPAVAAVALVVGVLAGIALQGIVFVLPEPPTPLYLILATAAMWQITKALQWPALVASRLHGQREGPWIFVITLGTAIALLTGVILLALS